MKEVPVTFGDIFFQKQVYGANSNPNWLEKLHDFFLPINRKAWKLYLKGTRYPSGLTCGHFFRISDMLIHPRKISKSNMEPENGGLEDEFPFQKGDFQIPCWFSGVYLL